MNQLPVNLFILLDMLGAMHQTQLSKMAAICSVLVLGSWSQCLWWRHEELVLSQALALERALEPARWKRGMLRTKEPQDEQE